MDEQYGDSPLRAALQQVSLNRGVPTARELIRSERSRLLMF